MTAPGPPSGQPPVPQSVVRRLDPRRDLPGRDDQPRQRGSRGGPRVLRRPPGAVARRRLSRHRGKSLLRDGDRVGRVGQAVWPAAAGGAASVSGDQVPARAMRSRRPAISCFTSAPSAWTCASSWRPRSWRGSATRSPPVDEVHGFRYFDDRDLLGFVDGTENPTAQAAIDAAYDRRRGRRLRRRQLRDRAEIPARHGRLECAVRRRPRSASSAAASFPTSSSTMPSKPVLRAQRADHHRGGRQGDQDRARQHAVRPRRRQASSAPTSSATPLAANDRADAGEHVRRPAARQLRPPARFQPWPTPAICSSCRRRRFWTTSRTMIRATALRTSPPVAAPAPTPAPKRKGSLDIGSLKGDPAS